MKPHRRLVGLLGTATIAAASIALLAACGGAPTGSTQTQGGDPQPTASSGGSASDLEYGLFFEESMLGDWTAARDALAADTEAFEADCTTEDTNTDADCNFALHALLTEVNGLKQLWLTFDNSEWDSGDLSGLEALKPTRDATLTASESGSAWSGSCGAASGNEDCPPLADTFIADLDALNAAFAEWPA